LGNITDQSQLISAILIGLELQSARMASTDLKKEAAMDLLITDRC
jgi:hypothetical protein